MYNFSDGLTSYGDFSVLLEGFDFSFQSSSIEVTAFSVEEDAVDFGNAISFSSQDFEVDAEIPVEDIALAQMFDNAAMEQLLENGLVEVDGGDTTSCCPCVACSGQNDEPDFVAALSSSHQGHTHLASDFISVFGSEGYDIPSLDSTTSNLTFTLNNTGGVEAGTQAEAGFLAAAALFSSFFTDDIDIRLDVGFAALGGNILGQAGSQRVTIAYEDYRDALIADGTSPDDATAIANLELGATLDFATQDSTRTYILDDDGSANNTFLRINVATALAVGLTTDANGDAIDDGVSAFANITFNSDFNFDFDPTDGIDAGSIDFVGVAFHEIGHSLGFTSGVDIVDNNPNTDLNGFAIFNQLDIFRYSDRSQDAFGAGTRDLGYGGETYFSIDGGATNIGLFSTGRNFGDGQQASHWKDGLGLGILDPTAAPRGQVNIITELDLRAFDVIGFDRVGQTAAIEGTEGDDNPLNGTADDDTINGLAGDDNIFGLGGNDTINGGDGIDRLNGGDGDDILNGDAGNDLFFGGAGANTFNGGAGLDRVFYSDATAGITANFFNPSLNTGDAAGDTYNGIESINGTNFNDVITSGNDNNDLVGLGGDDVLIGAGGRDRLFGGDGNDRLLGGQGNDDLQGNAGVDTYVIQSGAGADRIFTYEVGVDIIEYNGGPGSFADLTIEQVGANTRITSLVGSLTLIGITATDITAAAFTFINALPDATGVDVTTTLTDGDDTFVGDENDDIVDGLAGNDNIRGGIGDDELTGGEGNDLLNGGLGADILDGGDGIDTAVYSTASTGVTINAVNSALNTGEAAGDTYISIERFIGSNGNDSITSGNADNRLIGLGGDDFLIGAGGNDVLFGGNDDDRLLGGTGDDTLHGQQGADTFVFQEDGGNDVITDFEDGVDILEFRDLVTDLTDLTITQEGADTLITSANGTVTLQDFDSTLLDLTDFTFL